MRFCGSVRLQGAASACLMLFIVPVLRFCASACKWISAPPDLWSFQPCTLARSPMPEATALRSTLMAAFVTNEQHAQLLANGQAERPAARSAVFHPRRTRHLVIRIARRCRQRYGLRSHRPGARHARAGPCEAVRSGVYRRAAPAAGNAGSVFPGHTHAVRLRAAGAGQRFHR